MLMMYEKDLTIGILVIPNITNITYGRYVVYKIEQEILDDEIHSISATKIRKNGIEFILSKKYK